MIICKKCGHHNEDEAEFCALCRAFLEWSGERVVEASPPEQPEPEAKPALPPGFVDRVKQAVGIEAAAQPTLTPEVSEQRPVTPAPPAPPAPPLDARRPEDAPVVEPRPRPTPRVIAAQPEYEPGDVICPQCRIGNPAGRHFCRRCGEPLAAAAAARTPWWRRLLPQRRAPVAGDRPGHAGTVSVGGVVGRFVLTLVAVLAIGAVGVYALVPSARQSANDRADRLISTIRLQLQPSFVEVHPVNARASSELSGHPAQFAIDLVSNDYWGADTARDPQPTLVVTFSGKTDLDSFLVTSGANGPDYVRLARPRTLQITYSDGTGESVTLQDVGTPRSYTIHARQISSATIRITSVYPGTASTAVAIAELEFFHLK